MDKLLKDYLMTAYGVKKRTLQTWLKAGLIPGTIRTKGGRGHYRIRAPRGVTPELYLQALVEFGGASGLTREQRLQQAGKSSLPQAWWDWSCAVMVNVRDYNSVMRNVRRVFRGGHMPEVTLAKIRQMLKRPRRRTTSSASLVPAQ